jgi:hypothetical protein
MDVQSLLFSRDDGWTPSKSKAWAQSHGYKYGKVDTTGPYVRIRQFDSQGLQVKRTIPFGRGIRAVVAREGVTSMATTQETRRRRPSRRTREEAPGSRRRKTRESSAAEASRRPRRKVGKAKAKANVVAAPKRRRSPKRKVTGATATKRRRSPKRKARASESRRRRPSQMMEARRPRRRRARASEAWRGDKAGHRKAALKGVRRKKARRRVRASVMESPKRRRKSSSRRRVRAVSETPRRKSKRHYSREAKRGGKDLASHAGQLALAVVSGGLGFVLADGLDRLLSTYDPTATEKPKDKFTSDGAGTLANTLNVASSPGLMRIGAGIGMTAIPAVAAMYVDHPFIRSSLEGAAIGAGVSLFKTLWNNFLMPMLIGKDTSTAALQKSYIARLYPAEVAAALNLRQTDDAGAKRTPQTAVSSAGSGALSAPPADVGPFALAAPEFPTLQNVWGTGEFPTAAQVFHQQAGMADGGDGGLGALFGDIVSQVRRAMPNMGPAEAAAEAARRMHHEMTLRCRVVPHAAGVHGEAGVSAAPAAPTGLAAEPWQPGPPSVPGVGPQGLPTTAGPQPPDTACGCIGDDNPFLGFVGDEPAESASVSASLM